MVESGPGALSGYQQIGLSSPALELVVGVNTTLSLEPAWPSMPSDEGYGVWIDLNRDGDFDDDGETLLSVLIPSDEVDSDDPWVSISFALPSDVASGHYALRVAMQYNELPSACGEYSYGETEDHIVVVWNYLDYLCSSVEVDMSACTYTDEDQIQYSVSDETCIHGRCSANSVISPQACATLCAESLECAYYFVHSQNLTARNSSSATVLTDSASASTFVCYLLRYQIQQEVGDNPESGRCSGERYPSTEAEGDGEEGEKEVWEGCDHLLPISDTTFDPELCLVESDDENEDQDGAEDQGAEDSHQTSIMDANGGKCVTASSSTPAACMLACLEREECGGIVSLTDGTCVLLREVAEVAHDSQTMSTHFCAARRVTSPVELFYQAVQNRYQEASVSIQCYFAATATQSDSTGGGVSSGSLCAGVCGDSEAIVQTDGTKCYCEESCLKWNDCCEGYAESCMKDVLEESVCEGLCGTTHGIRLADGSKCYCEAECLDYNDCCEGYVEVCASSSTGSSAVCAGKCGDTSKFTAADGSVCYCEEQCLKYKDCCEDYEDTCG